MKPLVELSFMPSLLASGNQTWSHYEANVTPPTSYSQWADLIGAFIKHLIQRYGLQEILTWSFEVWNEPNCCPVTFWSGGESEYFKLFEYTSRAAKAVHPGIRVGGPATGILSFPSLGSFFKLFSCSRFLVFLLAAFLSCPPFFLVIFFFFFFSFCFCLSLFLLTLLYFL